jgi:hypothetical protein
MGVAVVGCGWASNRIAPGAGSWLPASDTLAREMAYVVAVIRYEAAPRGLVAAS